VKTYPFSSGRIQDEAQKCSFFGEGLAENKVRMPISQPASPPESPEDLEEYRSIEAQPEPRAFTNPFNVRWITLSRKAGRLGGLFRRWGIFPTIQIEE
jgi:hypothetical protein